MSTLSSQSLQSLTVAVGPGTTKELDTLLGTNSASITSLTTTVNTLDAFKTEITTAYTANLSALTLNGTVKLQDGFLLNTDNTTEASLSWESANQIVIAGLGAPATLTGQAGANGLIIGASGRRIGFLGTAPVVKQTVTGSKGANAALTSLLTALANLGLITDSSS